MDKDYISIDIVILIL